MYKVIPTHLYLLLGRYAIGLSVCRSLSLSVCLSVCLLAGLLQKESADFTEIWCYDLAC